MDEGHGQTAPAKLSQVIQCQTQTLLERSKPILELALQIIGKRFHHRVCGQLAQLGLLPVPFQLCQVGDDHHGRRRGRQKLLRCRQGNLVRGRRLSRLFSWACDLSTRSRAGHRRRHRCEEYHPQPYSHNTASPGSARQIKTRGHGFSSSFLSEVF